MEPALLTRMFACFFYIFPVCWVSCGIALWNGARHIHSGAVTYLEAVVTALCACTRIPFMIYKGFHYIRPLITKIMCVLSAVASRSRVHGSKHVRLSPTGTCIGTQPHWCVRGVAYVKALLHSFVLKSCGYKQWLCFQYSERWYGNAFTGILLPTHWSSSPDKCVSAFWCCDETTELTF
jgi:hypothetical protein